MNKKTFILFFLVFEAMQVIDLILTRYALEIPGNFEVNPLYSLPWFVGVKLLIPAIITIIMYKIDYFNKQASVIMRCNVAIYTFILLNNIYFLGAAL